MTTPSTFAPHLSPQKRSGRWSKARLIATLLTAILLLTGVPTLAQSPFSVAVRVNDEIVTNYEIQQRRRFLTLLNAPPQVVAGTTDALVNERLPDARIWVPSSS